MVAQVRDCIDVFGRIAGEGGDAMGETVAHADYAELRDRVLFKELGYEVLSVA